MAPVQRERQGFQRQPSPKLRPAAHELIGRRLRLHYEDLQQRDLPDRLAELLRKLDEPDEDPAPLRHD